jgi:hypothetical protein
MIPSPGETFGGYEIVEELGHGGMGRVFRARHLTLDRNVALKVLGEGFAGDEQYRSRFLKEARAAARLNHRNIVQIYDFGQVEETYYLAMEFVPGRSLGALLTAEGPFPETEAIRLTRHACIALGVAHAAGIVHRDVKPDNLILRNDGVLKLVDLGLAKSVSDDQDATQTGVVAGSPHYISPEQIEGRRDIDARADIYSLGATLFHLVTGKRPFTGSSPMVVIAKHLHEEPQDPRALRPELSAGLCTVIRRMMARDRDARYPDTASVDRDLEQLQSDLATEVMTPVSDDATIATGMPALKRAAAPAWDPAVIVRIEGHLTVAVGPMARLLVRNAAKRSADVEELCASLAQQIPSEAQRAVFLDAVHRDTAELQRRATADAPLPAATDVASGESSASAAASADAVWRPEALRALERLLATAVGPVARILVKREARSAASWEQLVAAVASQLPVGTDAAAFRDQAERISH